MAVKNPKTRDQGYTLEEKEESFSQFRKKARRDLLLRRSEIQDGKKFEDMRILTDEEIDEESYRIGMENANDMFPVKRLDAARTLDLPKPGVQDLLWQQRQRNKQKNEKAIKAQTEAQTEIGVQQDAMTGDQIAEQVRREILNEKLGLVDPPVAAELPVRKDEYGNNKNARVSSGWAADVSGVSPRQSLIDQAVADDKMKRGRGDMTSSQRQMVDNPVDPNRPNINYQALGAGPSEDRIAWAGARLNERMGDTTPEERRAAYEFNFPNAAANLKIGRENSRQAKARKDDDIALFRLQKRGRENSSHGDAIRKRINVRDQEFGAGSHKRILDEAKQIGEYAKSVAMTLPNATVESGAAAAAQAAELYFAENEWKIGNETGRRPLLRGRAKSEMRSPWSLETERIRFQQQNQNSRQRNEEFQAVRNTKPVSTSAPNRNDAVFSMQQKLEERYKADRNRQHNVDVEFRDVVPPTRLAGQDDPDGVSVMPYNPSDTLHTDMWRVDPSRTRSTGYGQARVLPERLYPINPLSKDDDDLNAYAKGQRYRAPTPNPRPAPMPTVTPKLRPKGNGLVT